MIADLKPYPAYKNSGVEWLGEVPEHWTTERLKSSMNNIVELTAEWQDTDLYVALKHVESWTGRLGHSGLDISFDSQVKCFRAGDILFGKLRPYLAKVTRPASDGVCVGEFLVVRPRHSNATAPYMEKLLRSKPVIEAVNSSTFGAKMPRADWQFMGGMAVTLPSLPEQAAIVRFLDHADRRIRRYIRAKQKLIALLEEQKQAVVHEAVTGRVDIRTGQPYPAYKDSGVEWLGDVPEHWEMRRLKSKLRPVDRRSFSGTETLLSLRRDLGVVVYAEHFSRPPQGATLVGYKLVKAGQLVINRLQANNGLLFCSGLSGVVSPDYSVFAPRSPVDMEYLGNLLRTVTYKAHFRRESTGLGTGSAGFLRLYDDRLLATPVALPPLEEQSTLLVSLSEITAFLCRAIGRQHVEIELLREYRTRLIADVVTGKLDVRGAADGLPEVDSLADDDALTTQAAETGVMELEDATESPEEFAMENEATV